MDGSGGRQTVRAPRHGLIAGAALPDAHNLSLHIVLPTEDAGVLGVLGDFNLLDDLTEGGTVTGAVFPADADFLGALTLCVCVVVCVCVCECVCVCGGLGEAG